MNDLSNLNTFNSQNNLNTLNNQTNEINHVETNDSAFLDAIPGDVDAFGERRRGRKKKYITSEERKMRLRMNKLTSTMNENSRILFLAKEMCEYGCEVEIIVFQHTYLSQPRLTIGEIRYGNKTLINKEYGDYFIDYYTDLITQKTNEINNSSKQKHTVTK